ncbi:MAG: cysteine desulfurase family protein [Candidatus Latescibacterota bacterium]
MIYLDHNATTPLDPGVLEAMTPYLTARFGNASSYHELGRQARDAVEEARHRVAACLGAQDGEIVFTGSGTEADNLALRGVAQARRECGRHILTSRVEHPAVLRTCQDLEREGFEVTFLPVDGRGVVDPDDLARALRPDTVLVSVMAANNETGALQPIRQLGALARQRRIPFHTDAVQAVGKEAIDVGDLQVNLLSLSAHKVHGPQGVGALYVRAGTPLQPLVTGGEQEGGRRAGTENVAGIVGLGEALSRATATLAAQAPRLRALRDRLEAGVRARLAGVTVNAAAAPRVANTASLSFAAVDGEAVLLHLDLRGICAATGSACTTGSAEPSHVLLAMGLEPRLAQGTVRFSLGCGNTEAEVDQTVEALAEIVPALRAISPFT